jgi:chemotaxis protein methyltransferase CheR
MRELIRMRCVSVGAKEYSEYSAVLRNSEEEWRAIADQLTVSETFFFRIAEQFDAFASIVLPRCIEAHAADRRLRIASLGCASGEEPYTIAMIIRSRFPELDDWRLEIVGFDLSGKALERANRGLYSQWSLRATPPAMKHRFFQCGENGWEIDLALRSIVRFETRNILDLCRDPKASYDIVFFRNVLIYFSPESTRSAMACASHVLSPGGYLFIGTAETLRGVSNDFSLCHTHGAFYYRREGGPDTSFRQGKPAASYRVPIEDHREYPKEIASDPQLPSASWIKEIRDSNSRVTELTAGSNEAAPALPKIEMRAALQSALAMFAREKFSAALSELNSLPPEKLADADVQVFRALLLTNSGKIPEAETAAQTALAHDHLNPAAHYVLALCREQVGDLPGALERDTMAAYLDPAFAMPHIHAATICKRAGEVETACAKMETARTLLASEDAARILLFGGGFSREALLSYCEREINHCRGAK